MLREKDFYDARKVLLPLAVGVRDWVHWEWGRTHGADVDYHLVTRKAPGLADAGEAVGSLDRIAGEHPSRAVRERAAHLRDTVDDAYNTSVGGFKPEQGELNIWHERAEELIGALHDPTFARE